MLQFVLDTDHLTLFHHGQSSVCQRMAAQSPNVVGLTVVTVEESLRGRLAAIAKAKDGSARIARYAQLLDSTQLFQQFPLLPFDQAAEDQYRQLQSLRLRIGAQDLKIAAVNLANNVKLVTGNLRDFGCVPGLVLEDWSH
jgi:tRNA(fMet)-specific endonuclease VapC